MLRAGGPSPKSQDMSLCGVYFALVTQNKDPEGLGRVKVRFPWLDGGDQDQSHWAQLSAPMSGSVFGAFTLPEIDDTVAVVFIAGDIRVPVVLGGVWSENDLPPDNNENGKNDFRLIKSRSSHRLLLDDSVKVKVVLTERTNNNHLGVGEFQAGGDGPNKTETSVPPPINGSPTDGVAVSALTGALNIYCPNGTLTVSGENVEFTASAKAAINVGGKLTIKAGSLAKLAASGNAQLQGTMKIG